MKIGDLVRKIDDGRIGIVEKIDKDFHGARQAFKRFRTIERGKAFLPNMVDGIGPTKDGIRDRVMVCWSDDYASYIESNKIEVIK